MVQSVPDRFIPGMRVCVTIMNGKTDLLKLSPKYANGYDDLSQYLVEDEENAIKIAKNLGVTVFKHHKDINWH